MQASPNSRNGQVAIAKRLSKLQRRADDVGFRDLTRAEARMAIRYLLATSPDRDELESRNGSLAIHLGGAR